jgi:hypothetical protein
MDEMKLKLASQENSLIHFSLPFMVSNLLDDSYMQHKKPKISGASTVAEPDDRILFDRFYWIPLKCSSLTSQLSQKYPQSTLNTT